MNALITRLAGMRQGMGLAVAIVASVYFAQDFLGQTQRLIPVPLVLLLFGAAFIVWSIEEYVRGNKLFAGVFSGLGLLVIGYSAYVLLG